MFEGGGFGWIVPNVTFDSIELVGQPITSQGSAAVLGFFQLCDLCGISFFKGFAKVRQTAFIGWIAILQAAAERVTIFRGIWHAEGAEKLGMGTINAAFVISELDKPSDKLPPVVFMDAWKFFVHAIIPAPFVGLRVRRCVRGSRVSICAYA